MSGVATPVHSGQSGRERPQLAPPDQSIPSTPYQFPLRLVPRLGIPNRSCILCSTHLAIVAKGPVSCLDGTGRVTVFVIVPFLVRVTVVVVVVHVSVARSHASNARRSRSSISADSLATSNRYSGGGDLNHARRMHVISAATVRVVRPSLAAICATGTLCRYPSSIFLRSSCLCASGRFRRPGGRPRP